MHLQHSAETIQAISSEHKSLFWPTRDRRKAHEKNGPPAEAGGKGKPDPEVSGTSSRTAYGASSELATP